MKRGVSLVEILVYVAVFTLLAVVVVTSLLGIGRVLRQSRLMRAVAFEGEVAMERIIRETRLAHAVALATSTFDVHPGVLEVDTLFSPATTTPVARQFFLSNGKLFMSEATSTTMTFILTPNTTVTNFVVSYPATTTGDISEAIRVEMTLEASGGGKTVSRNFFGGAVLRGAYAN